MDCGRCFWRESRIKEGSWRESFHLLQKRLSNLEQDVDRTMNSKDNLRQMRNVLSETGEKVSLVIKWQRAWLDYVHVLALCGR